MLNTDERRRVALQLVHHAANQRRPHDRVVVERRGQQVLVLGHIGQTDDALGVPTQHLCNAKLHRKAKDIHQTRIAMQPRQRACTDPYALS